jgi:transcription initiation factor TFIIIB Brf1 subunit/transcription initiation factor TFIIB
MNKSIKITNTCMECGTNADIASHGFIVCTSCGATKERTYVDYSPSYSANINNGKVHNSIGKNINFVGALGSQIGYSSGFLRGSRGKELNFRTVLKYKRLVKQHHQRSFIEGNATHLRTMIAFSRIINNLGLSNSIKSRSLFLYWKYVNQNKRITNHILLVALCLLQAVRETDTGAPIRFAEIISAFADNNHRVTNKNILRLARELGISLAPLRRKPEDYVNRIANQVVNDSMVIKRLRKRSLDQHQYEAMLIIVSRKILDMLSQNDRGGVQPYPFAVSIIYLADRAFNKALQKKSLLTQKILADAASSAEFTIRDHVYRFLGKLYKQHEPLIIREVQNHLRTGRVN